MAAEVSEHDLREVLHWLEDCTGIRIREDQIASTKTILRRIMSQLEVAHTGELKSALSRRPQVMDELVNQLTVGETYFFREPAQFDLISGVILPEIIARRGTEHTIRAWSAGCASGEEPYSLAILCFGQLISEQVSILATDISEGALRKARRAVFRPWSFRGDAMSRAASHLIEREGHYHLHDSIKGRVDFHALNLAADSYPSAANGTMEVDLILCRNVLIYFGQNTIRDISERFFECLAPGGWLLTASGDPYLGDMANFETIVSERGTAYRRPTRFVPRQTAETARSIALKPRAKPARRAGESRAATLKPGPHLRRSPTGGSSNASRSDDAEVPEWATDGVPGKVGIAWAALGRGEFERAARLTEDHTHDPQACLIHVKATAAIDLATALDKCRRAVGQHTLSEELHYLYGVLLVDANRSLEALQSLQKAIFLNRSSIMAHFLFGSIQLQQGQLESARRHFRNVCELCASKPPGQVLPFSSGETVADVAIVAESQIAGIDALETEG